jgi:hypothetical protein
MEIGGHGYRRTERQ